MTNFTKRERNLIKRFCDGEFFYHSETPRISAKEVEALSDKGFILQVELPPNDPTIIYPLNKKKFHALAMELVIVPKKRSGPKTKTSKGERVYVKYNLSLAPENDDYILRKQKKGELVTHTVNRMIAEHETLTSQPPKTAKYGLWSHLTKKWLEYYWADKEAAESAEMCNLSGLGLTYVVRGVNDTDDEWLNKLQA